MLDPVRKAGKFVKDNRVPIAIGGLAIAVGVIAVLIQRQTELRRDLQILHSIGHDMDKFLYDNDLWGAWDTYFDHKDLTG